MTGFGGYRGACEARRAGPEPEAPDGGAAPEQPRRRVRLAARALEAIVRHARESLPAECCGALIGRVAEAGGGAGLGAAAAGWVRIARALPLRNVASGARRYRIPPEDVRRAGEEAAEAGLDVVGFYHSHPSSGPVPSETDVEQGWPWYSYVVLDAGTGQLRAWRLAEDRSGFLEEDLRVLEEA